MTLLKSSKHKNLFPSAYRNALRAGMLPFVLFFAGMSLLFPISSVFELFSYTQMLSYGDFYDEEITHISQLYEYMLSPFGTELPVFMIAGTVVSAVLMGIFVFRFIVSKKTVNVYYSLGISRTNMFLARYTAGLTLLLIGIAVPVLVAGLISTVTLGFHAQIIPNMLYIILLLFTLAVLVFSITSAAFTAVGSAIEGTVFSLIIIALPTLLFLCFEGFTEVLLYGNPYVLGWYPDSLGNYVSLSMVEKLALYNPLLYVDRLFDSRYWWMLETDEVEYIKETGLTLSQVLEIKPLAALIWLVIGIAAAIIAVRNYNRRKAEICGFFGKSPVLNYIVSFAAGLAAFSAILYTVSDYSTTFAIILGFIAVAICYIAVNLIFTRSFKELFRRIYLLGAQLLSIFSVVVIFYLGCFGYSSDIPEISEIKSANISPVTFENLLSGDQISNYYYYSSDDLSAYRAATDNSTLGPYTDTQDIERITRIHRKFIELGGSKNDTYAANIVIRYELYNGETFIRYYNFADMSAIKQILNLFESKFFDEQLEESFFGYEEYLYDQFVYEQARVVAIDSELKTESYKYMDLSEEQFEELKRAVVDDIKAMSAQQFYTSDKPAIGIIVFTSDNINKYWDLPLDTKIDESKLHEYVYDSQSSSDSETIVYITEDMTQTLKFLNSNGMMSYFPSADANEIESIAFYPATLNRDERYYQYSMAAILEFRARSTNDDYYSYYEEFCDEDGNIISSDLYALFTQNLITDKEKIAEILPLTRLNYFTAGKGYVAFITYKNGESVEKYITEDEAPDWVKTYEYAMSSEDIPEQAQRIK